MVLTLEDAQIVGQDTQTDFPVLAVIGSGPQGRAEVALEHAEDSLNLPALAVEVLGKPRLHQPAIVSPHGQRLAVFPWPTALGRGDDAANAELHATEPMESFGLVPRVAQKTA